MADGVPRQRAETAEHYGLAQIHRERSSGFSSEIGPFGEAVGEKERCVDRPGGDDDAGDVADDTTDDGQMPELEFEVMREQPAPRRDHQDEEDTEGAFGDARWQHEQGAGAEGGGGDAGG